MTSEQNEHSLLSAGILDRKHTIQQVSFSSAEAVVGGFLVGLDSLVFVLSLIRWESTGGFVI